jgi:hypothetical protein
MFKKGMANDHARADIASRVASRMTKKIAVLRSGKYEHIDQNNNDWVIFVGEDDKAMLLDASETWPPQTNFGTPTDEQYNQILEESENSKYVINGMPGTDFINLLQQIGIAAPQELIESTPEQKQKPKLKSNDVKAGRYQYDDGSGYWWALFVDEDGLAVLEDDSINDYYPANFEGCTDEMIYKIQEAAYETKNLPTIPTGKEFLKLLKYVGIKPPQALLDFISEAEG